MLQSLKRSPVASALYDLKSDSVIFKMSQSMNRSALGRAASIGALYDVRNENFVHDSIFTNKIDDKSIDRFDLGDTNIEVDMSDRIQDKFHQLDIEVELQCSLLAGLVKLGGSGSYLKEEKKSARAQSMSIVYKIRTTSDQITLRHHLASIDTDVLTSTSATHVVVGIEWGALCTITCEYENTEGRNEKEVKGELKAELHKLKILIETKNSAEAHYADTRNENFAKFTFKCTSDVSSTKEDLPTTFEGAVRFAKSLPTLVEETNNGKGVPLSYMFLPLETVVKMCKLHITTTVHFASIKEDTIKQAAQVTEKITLKKQQLHDIEMDLDRFKDYISEDALFPYIDNFTEAVYNIDLAATKFRSTLQKLITKIRSENEDVSVLDDFLSSDGAFPFAEYERIIRSLDNVFMKIDFIRSWKDRGIMYLGKRDQYVIDDADKIYVLFKISSKEGKSFADKQEEFFLRCQRTYSQDESVVFKVVDQDIRPDIWGDRAGKMVIELYEKGVKTCSDLYEKEGKDMEMCLVKLGPVTWVNSKPSERANAKLRCPNLIAGSGQCLGKLTCWKCTKCKKILEYGTTTKLLYCECGQSEPTEALFRCNKLEHGIEFIKYPSDALNYQLSSLRAIQEKNILILGETGVGKSTWINGIVNYFSFSNWMEAKQEKNIRVLIPSKFTFITDEGKPVDIDIGQKNEYENLTTGDSSTQQTRAYIFYIGEEKIRLIDTPGIADTRGIEQDKKNFDNILTYLSNYDEIHAFCIVLKPNNPSLSVVFKFCIQELLARLHTSAKDNIVFCFTNARSTLYKPGETLPVLNRMLAEANIGIKANPHNYFCFDNEPFRFLACLQNGVEFSKEDLEICSGSWDKAVIETKRLFDTVNEMRPHKIKDTTSMNESRRIIVAMSKPLAEVAKTIHENVQAANDAKKAISIDEKGISNLLKNLKFTGFDLERQELPYPMTVCADSACIERVTVGKSNVHKINYKQICHQHCFLEGIPIETVNDSRLVGCWCIDGVNCHQCGHHYNQHMHITYNLDKVEKEFISDEIQQQIMAKKGNKAQIEDLKRAIDKKVNQLREEESKILKASAKFGAFLKENALIAYNDAIGDYIDHQILLEQKKDNLIRNNDLLERLRGMKAQYEGEKRIIDDAIAKGEAPPNAEQIIRHRNELFELGHFGKTLKKIFDGISITNSANSMHFQETVAMTDEASVSGGESKKSGTTKKGTVKKFLLKPINYLWPGSNSKSPETASKDSRESSESTVNETVNSSYFQWGYNYMF